MQAQLVADLNERPAIDQPAVRRPDLGWGPLPLVARFYVMTVIATGLVSFVAMVPRTYPQPGLFLLLLLSTCLTSTWKVNLPIPLASGSTLSVSYAANLMALLLLGQQHAMVVAVTGAWMQCASK